MSEISNYEAQKKKLQGLCDEHNFTFRFFKDRYPITLVITPINDVATQMDMLGNVEETGKLRNFGVPVPDVPDSNSQRDSQQDTKQGAPQDDPDDDDEPAEDSAEDDTEE